MCYYIYRKGKGIKRMTNFVMALHILDSMNCYHTYAKQDDFWVIDTEVRQFWFDEDGKYYGTKIKILELEDY